MVRSRVMRGREGRSVRRASINRSSPIAGSMMCGRYCVKESGSKQCHHQTRTSSAGCALCLTLRIVESAAGVGRGKGHHRTVRQRSPRNAVQRRYRSANLLAHTTAAETSRCRAAPHADADAFRRCSTRRCRRLQAPATGAGYRPDRTLPLRGRSLAGSSRVHYSVCQRSRGTMQHPMLCGWQRQPAPCSPRY